MAEGGNPIGESTYGYSPNHSSHLEGDVIETDGRSHYRDCSMVPPDVREAFRELKHQFLCHGKTPDIFHNREGLLPPTGPGSYYIEGRVGSDRDGNAGQRRVVIEVTRGSNPVVRNEYWTPNHYGANNNKYKLTFYRVRK